MINRVVLIGRLTRDPEKKITQSGKSVTSFTVAVNKDKDNADFINCVAWNKLADNVELYCSKSSLVGVEGKLQSRTYDNAQRQKVYVLEVLCSSVQFLDTKKKIVEVEGNNEDTFNIQEEDIQF